MRLYIYHTLQLHSIPRLLSHKEKPNTFSRNDDSKINIKSPLDTRFTPYSKIEAAHIFPKSPRELAEYSPPRHFFASPFFYPDLFEAWSFLLVWMLLLAVGNSRCRSWLLSPWCCHRLMEILAATILTLLIVHNSLIDGMVLLAWTSVVLCDVLPVLATVTVRSAFSICGDDLER